MQHRAIELCFRANKVEFLNKLQPIRRSRHVREFFTVRNGFLRQIRQQITISHAISQHKDSHLLITKEPPYGSSKVVSLVNGSQRVLSCGYMENLCSPYVRIAAIHFLNSFTLSAGSGKTVLWFVIA